MRVSGGGGSLGSMLSSGAATSHMGLLRIQLVQLQLPGKKDGNFKDLV